MSRSSGVFPRFMYRQLPWLYIVAGIATLFHLPSILGACSGLLLIWAGLLVLKWRGPRSSKRHLESRARKPASTVKRRRDSSGDRGYPRPRVDFAEPREDDSVSEPTAASASVTSEASVGEATAELLVESDTTYRRRHHDRRDWRPMPKTPFVDSKGTNVNRDRRMSADRRRGNIEVEEIAETGYLTDRTA